MFELDTRDTELINKLTTPEEIPGLLELALIALRKLHMDGMLLTICGDYYGNFIIVGFYF